MCGIFGTTVPIERSAIERCALTQRHRGPDGFGVHNDPQHRIALAHNRLAILDLSERGSQPMPNADQSLWLTYNGEIYNFRKLRAELESLGRRFTSETDSEVILQAYEQWGEQCLARFQGMFAFAIWDSRKNSLFLARDRLGIKPLYYHFANGQLSFASEPKAILAMPGFSKRVHYPGLFDYLMFGYSSGTDSIWEGIHKLLPGEFLLFDLRSRSIQKSIYWRIPQRSSNWTLDDAVSKAEELIPEVVSDHMISDVPVGVFLSGGIDSSLIAALAAQSSPAISSFTIAFEGWHRNEDASAALISNHLKTTRHVEVLRKDNWPSLADLMNFYDEPLADNSLYPSDAVSRAARRDVTVALAGDGGDEVFGGYKWFQQVEQAPFRRGLSHAWERVKRAFGIGMPWPETCVNRMEYYRFLTTPLISAFDLPALFPDAPTETYPASEVGMLERHFDPTDERYRRWQAVDCATYLIDNNLQRVDRASMAHSLEVRVPFLDHRVVEFGLSLPDSLRISDEEGKLILRKLLAPRVPSQCLVKPKQGFSCPVHQYWTPEEMVAGIRTSPFARSGLINPEAMNRILDNRKSDFWPLHVWAFTVLQHWADRWLL